MVGNISFVIGLNSANLAMKSGAQGGNQRNLRNLAQVWEIVTSVRAEVKPMANFMGCDEQQRTYVNLRATCFVVQYYP
jgi:hypothetical protein